MELRRLTAGDYDALLTLLNEVFARHNGSPQNFEKMLPKMWGRDDAHMGKHLGVFDGGALVACIGVYPLETVVNGEKLLFSTMGNIATHWDHTGKGYMSLLIDAAMKELETIGADASRLGGNRHRYNRYGFESCGQLLHLTFAPNTLGKYFTDAPEITFERIAKEDREALDFCANLYNRNAIAVTRNGEDSYAVMTAWENVPYLCLIDGQTIGYLCADAAGGEIAEIFAIEEKYVAYMLRRWQARLGKAITFSLQPHQIRQIQIFSAICDSMTLQAPTQYKIMHWERVISAFLKLKATYCQLPEGELILQIQDYGTLRIFVTSEAMGCEPTEKTPQLTLSQLEASRMIFGPLAPNYTANTDISGINWFPLPLSWNGQDRV